MLARGRLAVPGDKSITHRTLMLGALSAGPCVVRGALAAGDTRASAAGLRALGVKVGALAAGRPVHLRGGGLRGFRRPARPLDCRNSGTTARLLMGLLAAHPFVTIITGDASLRRRPMRRIADPLTEMGARVETTDGRLPVTVRGGPLRGIEYASPVASAQVKTALLFAGLAGHVRVSVSEPVRSRDHTERLLAALGVTCLSSGAFVALDPPDAIPAFDSTVPGDFSSAAYLVAAGILARESDLAITGVGINPTRTGLLRALERMGAHVGIEDETASVGEPSATLTPRAGTLTRVEVAPDEVPSMVDEIVLLACLASRAEGTSVFRGVGELRVKESDRLALVAQNLVTLGVRAHSEGDTLWVEGTDRPPAGRVVTAGDHRLAMSFAVLGTVDRAQVTLDDPDCVAVSYPSFFTDLRAVLHRA